MTLEEIKAMPAAKVAECLIEHQKLRRGKGKYSKAGSPSPHDPYDLGLIIDRAIESPTQKVGVISRM